MDSFFAYASRKEWSDGVTKSVEYYKVEVIVDITPQGPMKGEKYERASYFEAAKALVFEGGKHNKCTVVGFDKDGKPIHLC